MSRRFVIPQAEAWVGPVVSAARAARSGDTIVVHSSGQRDFLRKELSDIGKQGVRTVNTRQRHVSERIFDVRDPGMNTAKPYNWIQYQAEAARQRI